MYVKHPYGVVIIVVCVNLALSNAERPERKFVTSDGSDGQVMHGERFAVLAVEPSSNNLNLALALIATEVAADSSSAV